MRHMADGGIFDDIYQSPMDDLGAASSAISSGMPSFDPSMISSPSNVAPDFSTANGSEFGFGTRPGYATIGGGSTASPAMQSSSATTPPSTPSGFEGWLQSKHGGIKGSDYLKAGLTALTGILSGVANGRASKANPGKINGNAPPSGYRPTSSIGVPVSFNAGGNVNMNSPMEPEVYMAEGGNVHMTSPFEPEVYMAEGGQPPMEAPQAPRAPQQQAPQDQQRMLVGNAIKAILGQSQNPEADIQAFIQAFGQESLQQLVEKVKQMGGGQGQDSQQGQQGIMPPEQPQQQQPTPGMATGGYLKGPGTGLSDSIVANGGKVRVATGEFVIPSDLVSSIGDGDSDSGARKLHAAMDGLRKKKYGRSQQPPAIPDHQNPMLSAMK